MPDLSGKPKTIFKTILSATCTAHTAVSSSAAIFINNLNI